jgi:16S rRNA (guanine(966)-N(2))-methyltransferase RsmD
MLGFIQHGWERVDMRIISGQAKGKRLTTLKGKLTRPTSDRVREAIFSIIFSKHGSLSGDIILDLFAGSGAMGLEALSRGAQLAVLVEKSPKAVSVIQQNLKSCGFSDHARIIASDAFQACRTLQGARPFDLIFIDPPYNQGLAGQALESVAAFQILAAGGLACVETSDTELLLSHYDSLACTDRRYYGSTQIHFYSHLGQDMS